MKRFFISIILGMQILIGASAQEYLSPWQEGSLEIHAISTGKGEALLYILPDGTTMLVDCGDTTDNGWVSEPFPDASKAPGKWVAKYIRDYTGRSGVDYFLLSHFHGDHSGATSAFKEGHDGYKLAGITDFAEEMSIGKIVDRGYPSYDFPSASMVQREPTLNYIRFVQHCVSEGKSTAEAFKIGSHKQFPLLHDPKTYRKSLDIWNLAANCSISTGHGLKTRPMYKAEDNPSKFDENMFSCAQLIRYGKFSYFHGGDLPGGYWEADKPTRHERYYDAQVADLIEGPVTVVKSCHHGTRDSSSPHFLWTLRPQLTFFMSYNTGHPTANTVERILDPMMPGGKMLFSTSNVCSQRLGDLWNSFGEWGHIVIRVYPGGESWQVFVLDSTTGDYRLKYSSPVFDL